jgi:hypothetical protein
MVSRQIAHFPQNAILRQSHARNIPGYISSAQAKLLPGIGYVSAMTAARTYIPKARLSER